MIKLWEAPESMCTMTSRDSIRPRTFMDCGEQNATKEETQSAAILGPYVISSSLWIRSRDCETFVPSSSLSMTHNTCNVFCLQQWPEEKRSSQGKHKPLSLRICISRSVSLRTDEGDGWDRAVATEVVERGGGWGGGN